ncbi:MAG: DUF4248 domain-containing protein [Saprospiraceae bacterium]|nr:DUF4248 domain-containing protein [Saprospiraceae bacterium]
MKEVIFETEIKAYSKKELCRLYNISHDVLRRWLKPIEHLLPYYNPYARIFTPAQVKVIFETLGEP